MPPTEQLFNVWIAYGEAVIVSGNEPVWEEPGKQASLVQTIEAPDYETACQLYRQSLIPQKCGENNGHA